MFRPRVPCACCFKEIITDPQQKKTHYFSGCGCPIAPLVCSNCRKNSGKLPHTTICGWCKYPGLCESFQFARQASYINNAAKEWQLTQKRFSDVSIPYITMIRFNWLRYHEFKKIKFIFRVCNAGFAISFFASFMQAQMFKTTGAQKISIQYDNFGIRLKLFWLMKNITIARMLICNLFRESKNTKFFTGRRNVIKTKVELMSMVLHRLLSNFALLIR
jgi:hypothetical protein